MKAIGAFTGNYFFLSNFYNSPIEYHGLHFLNNEAAFQAMKCPARAEEFCNLTPSEAKRLGRKVDLRDDWEYIKEQIMYEVCERKFSQNPDLLQKLLATDDAMLIEGNNWGDTTWGMCNGVGENKLGNILMRIRSNYQNVIAEATKNTLTIKE